MDYLDPDQTTEKMRPRGARHMRTTRPDRTRSSDAREKAMRRRIVREMKLSGDARLTSR